jgi:hypothetical protein
MAMQSRWHNTLVVMDVELVHKPGKDNVVLDVLSCKREYQGEMFWENIQILWAMFVKESNLERKERKLYVENHLA